MNRYIKHFAIILALMFSRSIMHSACFAEDYTGGFTQLKSSISSTTTAKSFIANDNMESISTLGAMSGATGVDSVLSLYGANYNLNGAGYSGVTLVALRTLNVNNFGSLNPDGSVLNSIKNFNSVGNGAFVYNNGGTVAINNSVFSSNTATSGGVFYNNSGNSTIAGSTFYNNSATSQGGAFFNAAGDFVIKNSSFTNNSAAKTISTISTTAATSVLNYGGAIYNGVISSVTGAITRAVASEYTIGGTGFSNTFNNNFTASINSGSTTNYDNIARGYGGAIYSSVALTSSVTGNNIGSRTSTTNINLNTFSGNTNTVTNSATTTNGTSYAEAFSGAVYTSSSATTSGAGTGTNTATNTTNIKGNSFSSNEVKSEQLGSISVTRSPARTSNSNAFGGAIYNTTAASSSTTASTNSNSTVATNIEQNSINNNNSTALNSRTSSGFSASYTASTNAYGYGGAIYNSATTASSKGNASNTTNINNNTSVNSNSVVATNNSNTTLGTSNSYGYGGAIYNTTRATNSGSGTAVNSTSVSNNSTINNNSITATNSSNTTTGPSNAYGYGGAIYNIAAATASATSAITSISESTNTTDILSNDISNNFILSTNSSNTTTGKSIAYGYGGAIFNSLTATANSTGTNSANNTVNINNNNFNANYIISENNGEAVTGDSYARTYGGTIYNTTASTASGTAGINTSNVITNIKNNIVASSSATSKNAGLLRALSAATRSDYAEANGGAIFNASTATASSNGTNTANNTTNIQNNSFDNNMATAINTSTAVGYSTTYLANTNSTSRGGSIYNSSTTTASGIGNATSLLNITGNTSFSGNSATTTSSSDNTLGSSTAYGYGGAIYNTTAASNSGTGTALNKTIISDNTLYSANSVAVTNSSIITTAGTSSAYGYGGAIYNTTTAGITGAGNTSNTTDISNNTFNDNFINSKNDGTAFGSNSYGYGGVIYNITTSTASATSAIIDLADTENITNILSNNFNRNYISTTNSNTTTGTSNSYGYGGAIYNRITATANSSGINTALNTFNIESLFNTNSITAINSGAITNGNSYADAYGGAIYNITNAAASSTGTNTATVTTNITDSTINDNSAVGKNLGAVTSLSAVTRNNYAEVFGGALYNNSTATASSTGTNVATNTTNITGNTFNDNFALALNNSTVKGYNNSYLTNTNTNGYGGAIYNLAAATASGTQTAINKTNINENSFDGNYVSVTNSSNTTTGTSGAYGYGGNIFNSLTSTASGSGITNTELNINANSLFRNNSLTVTNSATTTTGSSNAYGYGGAIYATASVLNTGAGSATHLTNINNNIFDTSTLNVTNSGTTLTGTSTARSYGGAIFVNTGLTTASANSASNTTNIKDNEFKNNSSTATNSSTTTGTSTAYSYGGAIYTNTYTGDSGAVDNSSVSTTNITGNTFEQNSAVAINSSNTTGTKTVGTSHGGAIYNTMSSTNSSTGTNSSINTVSILDNTFKKNSADNGGAIYNVLSSTNSNSSGTNSSTNTLDIKDNTFEENTALNGGAIYSTWTSTGTNLSVNTVNIVDNTFKLNTAGYGGAIYNTAGGLTISNNIFDTNSAKYGGAFANYISTTTGTGTATINVDDGTFEKNFAQNTSSTTAITSAGGAIYNCGYATSGRTDLNINIVNSTFDANYTKAESTWANIGGYANAQGGAIYNYKSSTTGIGNSILNVKNTTFKNNYANASSTSGYANAQGGAIYNASAGTQIAKTIIDGGTFNDNYVQATAKGTSVSDYAYGYGGAIYNTGQLDITNSSFNRNNATATGITASTFVYGRGGAIYNTGTTTITNTTFADNTAKSQGGAIYNTGTLKLVADNGTTSFTGNKANNVPNALYLAGGTTYLNAGNGGIMTFNDKIASSAISNVINVNKTDLGVVSDGEVIFNENVSDSTINLYSGMLTLGQAGNTRLTDSTGLNSSNLYMNNVKLNVYDAILNLANNNATDRVNLNSFTSTADSSLYFDADFSTNQNDMITVSSAIAPSNVLDIGKINILHDGVVSSMTLFSGGNSPILSAFNAYTTDYKYYFTPATAGVYDIRRISVLGLNYAIDDTDSYRSFSATEDTYADYNLGTMGGAGSTLDIFGNDKSIIGLGLSGVSVLSGQTLNITNIGSLKADGTVNTSWNGFSSVDNGGAIYNNGTVKLTDSVFYNNSSTANGGLLYNTNTATVNTSAFVSNSATAGGAIYNTGTLVGSGDSFTSSFTTTGNGGAVYNSSTATLANSIFKGNNALLGNGGAIFNSGTFNLTGATFGGSSLSDANSAKNGGAVYNSGNVFLSDSSFENNTASINGGAINNSGTMQITNSVFGNNNATSNGGAIYNSGILKIIADDGTTSFTGNKASGASNAIYLASGSVMNVNAGNGGTVTFNDKITSEAGASIDINKTNVSTNLAGTTFAPTDGKVTFNENVNNFTINFYNGTMFLNRENLLDGNNLNLYGGAINLINNSIGTANFNNLSLNGVTNLAIDANLVSGLADKITSANPVTGTGSINVNQVNTIGSSSAKSITMSIADANVKDYITVAPGCVMGNILKYDLNYDKSTGSLMYLSGGSNGDYKTYNPAILTSTINTQTGSYLNQANVYNEALGRMDALMSSSRYDRLMMKYQNKVASADGNFVFSPTFLQESSKGLWFKQYATFENVPVNNGPNVSNVSYGMLIGGDTDIVPLKHGFDGYLTTYVGYNGSHQNYASTGVYQNGGLVGLTGTAYKGDFFTAVTLNLGGNNGNAYTTSGVDNFNTLVAGAAIKSGYNFEFLRGKLIVQPSLMGGYTLANTFDYTTAAGVNMTSDPLQVIQVVPGIKLIGNLENGWQPYVATNMVWNISTGGKFYANDVQLPEMSIAPYVEYGIGLQRKWGDRLTGFAQTMLRGGGRNGISLQWGFRWAI